MQSVEMGKSLSEKFDGTGKDDILWQIQETRKCATTLSVDVPRGQMYGGGTRAATQVSDGEETKKMMSMRP